MRISDWSSDVCSSDLRARPSWRARRRQCRSSNCARIEMAGFLDGDLTTIALCWRLERRDGVTIGLTTHDRDLMIGGLLHRAAPGMTPSARSEEHTSELQSLMRISYAVFCLKQKTKQ